MAESAVVIKDLGIDQLYDFIAADCALGRDVAQVFKNNKISGDLISELTDNDVRNLFPKLNYGAILRLRQLRSQHTQPVTTKGDVLDVETPYRRDSSSETACNDSKSEETNPFSQSPCNADMNLHSHQDTKFPPPVKLIHDSNSPTATYIVGEENKSQEPHSKGKVLLLVGVTGVGKGTLVNAIGNFLYGVQWEGQRLTIIRKEQKSQASSQRSQISIYKFVHQRKFPIPSSVTVIDTPGFGGTGGLQKDENIASQLKHLLNHDIEYLDALVLVVKASDARVNSVQKSILHTIQQHFGKDIQKNIFIVATYADSTYVRALEGLKASGFPFTKEHLFPVNNVVLDAPATSEDEDEAKVNRLIWDRNIKTYRKMFDALQAMTPVSLHLTQNVLEEWEGLTRVLNKLRHQIHHAAQQGVTKIDKCKIEVDQRSTENQMENERLLKGIKEKLERLQEISLISNSHVTLTGYIEVMIKEETEKPSENHDEVLAAFEELHRKAQRLMKKPSVSEDAL